MLKYYIDKYNLTFVYNKEFEGGGKIKNIVIPFTLFSIFLFQFMNIGYFYVASVSKSYIIGGLVLLCVEVILILVIRSYYLKMKKKVKK